MRLLLATTLTVAALASPALSSAHAAAPVHSVSVTGTGVSTWPAFAPGVERFAIRTDGTPGDVIVTPRSSDDAATITINGRAATNGAATTISGLGAGDEVNVQITDGAGTSNQSWIYLPQGFPETSTTREPGGPTAGHVALTLSDTLGRTGTFETIVDRQGVPAVITEVPYSHNLMRQPNGSYTVARGDTKDLFSSFGIVELDEELRPVRELRMHSVNTTDFHDVVLLDNGHRILMAYYRNPATGTLESRLEEVDAAGSVVLTWNSADHVKYDPAKPDDPDDDVLTRPLGDDAHLNSIEVMRDGNLLLSFRHLSQVIKIDRETGDVIWRLGGTRNEFAFPDDEYRGPCAQHTARELANGDIQIFDNGAKLTSMTIDKLCPNPADLKGAGPRTERDFSRVTTYRLDTNRMEAHLVSEQKLDGFSQFAGSAQRLGANTVTDNVMVGLFDGYATGGVAQMPDALEMTADGAPVWSLSAKDASSYRALAVPYRDAREPVITVEGPVHGTTYQQGDVLRLGYSCSDQGGSNLATCEGSVPQGSTLDMTPGSHTLTFSARDRAGNTTTRSVTYTVAPAQAPVPPTTTPTPPATAAPAPAADAMIRKPGERWKGRGTTSSSAQRIALRVTGPTKAKAQVKVRNSGTAAGRMALAGAGSTRWAQVRWYAGRRDVTSRVVAGSFRTRALAPGESIRLRLVVTVRDVASLHRRTLRLAAHPAGSKARDVVRARLVVR